MWIHATWLTTTESGRARWSGALLAAAFLLAGPARAAAQEAANETALAALTSGDECSAADGAGCALHALQRRGREVGGGDRAVAAAIKARESAAEAEAEADRLLRAEAAAEEAAESLRALLSPRLRYNSSAFGGRRAPAVATQYDGLEDQRLLEVQEDSSGVTHVFAIGDWGAVLPEHTTAPNKRGPGHKCPENCHFVQGIDDRAQLLVANVMKQRAGRVDPQYVLNVGDNFYWAGIPEDCRTAHADGFTFREFAEGWQSVYGGLANRPWISCLGNHDYGGWMFSHGWPQQIGYSFVNRNWILPGRYYSIVMNHPSFSVEYFVIDSNAWDAMDPDDESKHNMCSRARNPAGASCAASGGPSSVDTCKDWFWSTYAKQKEWLKAKLAASTADWQVAITHFPCGTDAGYWRTLHQHYGLDLLATGHTHDQELWPYSETLGGLTCFITGGGGGITSEKMPSGMGSSQYGFFDLSMSKDKIHIELIALNGNVIQSATIRPKKR